jgi:site-specific recombinase XerD
VQIAVNSYGQSWTESGFNASWGTFKKGLEAEGLVEPGLTMHGLRHTLGTRLREAGADARTIADILRQKSVSMGRFLFGKRGAARPCRRACARIEPHAIAQ